VIILYCTVWYCIVLDWMYGGYGMVMVWSWYGMVWYGLVLCDMVLCTFCISCRCVAFVFVGQEYIYIHFNMH